MKQETGVLVLSILSMFLVFLYLWMLVIKMRQQRKQTKYQENMMAISMGIHQVIQASHIPTSYIQKTKDVLQKRSHRRLYEEVLLTYLENETEVEKYLEIAYHPAIDLPQYCLQDMKRKQVFYIILGCQKAGLYQYQKAIPTMLELLRIQKKGDVQLHILLALSRLGDVSAMEEAFTIMQDYILVNARAITMILHRFSGNQQQLYKVMLSHPEGYIVALFLQSIPKEIATELQKEIIVLLKHEHMEVRIAALKAIGSLHSLLMVNHILPMLEDTCWEVRAIACKILGEYMTPVVGKALIIALTDAQWWVRKNAIQALLQAPDKEVWIAEILSMKHLEIRESTISLLQQNRHKKS